MEPRDSHFFTRVFISSFVLEEPHDPIPFTRGDLIKPTWLRSFIKALILLCISFVCEHFAMVYALAYSMRPTSTYVGDLLLDNLPVVNLNFIIVEGAMITLVVATLFIVFFRPRYILFSLKALAILIIVRALFMSLTHIGIYPGHIDPGPGFFDNIYSYFNLQTGFFFSGHTGLPFLMSLIFWRERFLRNILLSLTLIFGIAVLFAHVHYSIDVLAAPFMTYGIFKIAQYLFPRDYQLIEQP
ncbi:MAG: phosphatase PAP2-related protein [Minisyncoccia bacterium]|jgi:hypothetical protein